MTVPPLVMIGQSLTGFFVDFSGGSKYSTFVTIDLLRTLVKGTHIVWERVTKSVQEMLKMLADIIDCWLYLTSDILKDLLVVDVFIDDLFDVSIKIPYCDALVLSSSMMLNLLFS